MQLRSIVDDMDAFGDNPIAPPHFNRIATTVRLLTQFEALDSLLRQLENALDHNGPEAANDHEHRPSDVHSHAREILVLIGDFSDDLPRFAPDVLRLESVAETLKELKVFLTEFCQKLDALCICWPETLVLPALDRAPEYSQECHAALGRMGLECASASEKVDRIANRCEAVARSLGSQLGDFMRGLDRQLGPGQPTRENRPTVTP